MLCELLRHIFEPTILNDDVISVIASFGYRPPERYGVKAILPDLLQRKSWHRHFPRLTEKANILSNLLEVKLVKRTKYISKERVEFIDWFKLDGLVNGHQHRLVNAFLL